MRELQSIVDYGRIEPAIDPVFSALPAPYWSSTDGAHNHSLAYSVGFLAGCVDTEGLDWSAYYVRAVRGGL